MTRAFVFSGGGSLGAVQAGKLLALTDAGIHPDLVAGASVGAINAAWVAADPSPESAHRLAELWRSTRRADVFPTRLLNGLLGFIGRRRSLIDASGLRHLIERNRPVERLEDLTLPVRIVAADLLAGFEVVLSEGPVADALAASAAIPGVFPPVEIDGRHLVDGGVVNDTPISQVVEAGADEIWVLPAGYACALEEPPDNALGVAMQALSLMIHQRLAEDVLRYRDATHLLVAPPLCPLSVSPVDFRHTSELITRAEESTRLWLEGLGDRETVENSGTEHLALHRHRRQRPAPSP